jgi:uncharacterized DUF497 family protein
MQIDFDPAKEARNRRKHGLDFSFARLIFADPLATTIYDRFQDGEHRWHTFSLLAGKLLLVVHTFPDPDHEEWVRLIGLREATPLERKRYEEGID